MSHSHWEGQRGTGRGLLIFQRHREAFPIPNLNLSLPLDPLSFSRIAPQQLDADIQNPTHIHIHHGRHQRHSGRCSRDQWDFQCQHEWRTSLPVSYRLIDGQPPPAKIHLLAVILTVLSAIPERQLPVKPIPARGRLAFQCRQVQDHRVDAARSVIGNNGTLWIPTADSLARGRAIRQCLLRHRDQDQDVSTRAHSHVDKPMKTLADGVNSAKGMSPAAVQVDCPPATDTKRVHSPRCLRRRLHRVDLARCV